MKTVRLLPENELHKCWAAYLNMARHNLFTTLTFIARVTEIQRNQPKTDPRGFTLKPDNEEEIHMMAVLKDIPGPEKEKRLAELLLHHFPFLKYVSQSNKDCKKSYEPSLEEMTKSLALMARVINFYRNRYSHGQRSWEVMSSDQNRMIEDRKRERICGKMLTALTTASIRTIKERYRAGNNRTQEGMIDENSFKFITDSRMDMRTRKMNTGHFLYPVTLDQYLEDNEGRKCMKLTSVGLIQLTCLFLQKKYANEFLFQSHFLDAFEESAEPPKLPKRRLISEVLTAMSVKMPESKLSMKNDAVQVALDALNEIRKCPKELFDLLSDEDRCEFMTTATDGSPVLLRRHGDRFPQLALKLLDTTKALPTLRFHVNTGCFRFLFNENKTCIDGKQRVRVLQKAVNGFGRIQEVEKMRQDCLSGAPGQLFSGTPVLTVEQSAGRGTEIFPYITDATTRYFMDGDNIAMSFGDRFASFRQSASGKPPVDNPTPDIWMSRHSLQGMLFLNTLAGGKAVEDVVRKNMTAFRNLFSDIASGVLSPETVAADSTDAAAFILKSYEIRKADIPEKILEYLSVHKHSSRFAEYKESLVKTMIQDSKNRLERMKRELKTAKSSGNKPGKKSFVRIRPGKLAESLAQDIVLLQRESAQRKMTGLNYSIMQGAIASFSSQDAKGDLTAIFIRAGLIGENCTQGTHPFLHDVMHDSKTVDTVSFLVSYHKRRLSFLNAGIDDKEPFLHPDSGRWAERDASYYRRLAQQYLSRPVCLPRTVFEEPIRQALMAYNGKGANELHGRITTALNDEGRCNTSFMVINYFHCCLKDYAQPFYGLCFGGMDHNNGYRFFTTVRNHPKAFAELKKSLNKDSVFFKVLGEIELEQDKESVNRKPGAPALSLEEEIELIHKDFKIFTETEKTLRRYSVQDQVLFLAASKVIERTVELPNGSNGLLLREVGTQDSLMLNGTVSFDAGIKLKSGAYSSIHMEGIKLKDSGNILRLLNDRRVQDILEYHKEETVSAAAISEEIERYDGMRVTVFGSILEYENKILDGIGRDALLQNLEQKDSKHVDFKFVQTFDSHNKEASKTTLRVIRNAFSHNSYPRAKERIAEKEQVIIHDGSIPGTAISISQKAKDIADHTPSN